MYVYVVYLYDMYDSNIYLYNSNNFNNITTIIYNKKVQKYTDIISDPLYNNIYLWILL